MSDYTVTQVHPVYPSATPKAPEAPKADRLTPYQAAKLVNQWLVRDELDKVIPPQMMYNYTAARINKGKAPLIPATKDENNKVWISNEDLATWYATYSKKVAALSNI